MQNEKYLDRIYNDRVMFSFSSWTKSFCKYNGPGLRWEWRKFNDYTINIDHITQIRIPEQGYVELKIIGELGWVTVKKETWTKISKYFIQDDSKVRGVL